VTKYKILVLCKFQVLNINKKNTHLIKQQLKKKLKLLCSIFSDLKLFEICMMFKFDLFQECVKVSIDLNNFLGSYCQKQIMKNQKKLLFKIVYKPKLSKLIIKILKHYTGHFFLIVLNFKSLNRTLKII